MLKRTRQNFNNLKKILLRQKQEVEQELKEVEKDDPVMKDGLAESIESGEASWLADVHTRALSVKDNLTEMLSKTQKSLTNLKKGKYGKCENCGKQIELARLEAMPTATLCISCSKKASKKS